jgi:exopolysaccharide production protein ExoQ
MIQLETAAPESVQPATTPIRAPGALQTSAWIWVPWVWLLFASTRSPSSWLSGAKGAAAAAQEGAGSPLDRLIMTGLMALGLIVLSNRWDRTRRLLVQNKWMVALIVYMTLSIIWSNFPGISFRRCNRSVGAFEMALVVLTEIYPLQAVRTLLYRLFLVHIPLSVIVIKYFRNIGVVYNWSGKEEQWVGLTTDKNSLGQVATCAGVFFLWLILQEWPERKSKGTRGKLALYFGLMAADLWLLRGSPTVHSSTAIIEFIVCGAALSGLQLIKKRHARAKRIILGTTLAVLLLAPFTYLACVIFDFSPFQAAVSATGRDMTFTDRTLIWTDVLNDTRQTALLGVGIGAFWVGPAGYDKYPMPNWSRVTPEWRPEEGHNGYIDVYAELGIVGLGIFLVATAVGFIGSVDALENDFQFGSLRLVILLSIIINNITETSFLRGEHDFWFLFLLTAVNVPLSLMRIRAKSKDPEIPRSPRDLRERFKSSPWARLACSSQCPELPLRFPAAAARS